MRGRDHPASPLRTRLLPLLAVVSAMAVIGCGRSSGPRVWRVSGTVLYGGKPVLAGTVLLTPDGAQKNRGRQGLAEIKNGRFDTRGSTAPGIEGGPMIVQVTGLVDSAGTLFSVTSSRQI